MKATIALVSLLLLPLALAQITTKPAGCTNFACKAVEERAAICDSQESTKQSYANCFCTEVVKVNWDRCVKGFVCKWDGTGSPNDDVCIAEFCAGEFPASLQPQTICGFNGTSTGIPESTPTTVSGSNTTAPGSTVAVPTSMETTTRVGTSTTAPIGAALTTSTTRGASTLDISLGVIAGTTFNIALAMYIL